MTNGALIRLQGPMLELSVDGQVPLPQLVTRKLAQPMTYTHQTFVKGYDPSTGFGEGVISEERRLYTFDALGRFCCQKGLLSKVTQILRENGYEPTLLNKNPEKSPRTYAAAWDRVFQLFTFRPLQDQCLAQIDMHDGGIIDAVTAFGKGVLIAMICVLYPHARIDIITKKKDVVGTLRNTLLRYMSGVGQVGGGKRRKERITIYTADSLHHSTFDADIVLVDEVHEMMTDRYCELLARYWYARMYGFTASKETRFDNAYHRMDALFGPTIFHLPYPRAQELGLVVPIVVQWFDVEMNWNPCKGLTDSTARKRNGIWKNDIRNQVIASAASSMVAEGFQTLILVDTVEHAVHLRRFLPDFTLCYSEQAIANERYDLYILDGLLRPDEEMTAVRRESLRRAFERREFMGAIATGVWSVGVSFDSLQVLVRADAGASETANIQAPGRVCRIDDASGKSVGIVLDFNDKFDSKFTDRSTDRRRAYARNGWTQRLSSGRLYIPKARSGRGTV